MKNILICLSVVFVLVATSCSKDQKAVNSLEGSWEIKSAKVDGYEVTDLGELSTLTFTFEKCKIKKGACDGRVSQTDQTGTFSKDLKYEVSEKATKLKIEGLPFDDLEEDISGDLKEVSKTKFVWEFADDGETIELTFEKK